MTYTYSATQNNGTQQTDSSGEQVAYTYDSLNRLISATASGSWGLSFSYDGFGNRTASTPTQGSAPSSALSFDRSNHVIGFGYDANGNMTSVAQRRRIELRRGEPANKRVGVEVVEPRPTPTHRTASESGR